MAARPLTDVLGNPATQSLRGFENAVRERLAGRMRLTAVDAHMLLDGRAARWSPALDRRTGALLVLFGYRDPGDGVFERHETWPEEARRG